MAGKSFFYTVWVKIQLPERMLTLVDFAYFFQNFQNCKQIIGMSRRSIFHAAKSSQIPYTAKINKINIFNNKIENPLELRLAEYSKQAPSMVKLNQVRPTAGFKSLAGSLQLTKWRHCPFEMHMISTGRQLLCQYSTCHNYIGVGQMCRKIFGAPRVNRKWD